MKHETPKGGQEYSCASLRLKTSKTNANMANNKIGFNYYCVDTDRYQDRRIKKLRKNFGCVGLAVYDYLLCEIYRDKGCFSAWDEDAAFDVAEYLGIKENTVAEVVKYCGVVGLFDATLLSRGTITSPSIQRRFLEMCKTARRQNATIPPGIDLISKCRKNGANLQHNVGRMAQNSDILPQSKESKESKESRESKSACADAHTHEEAPHTPLTQEEIVLGKFEKFCANQTPTLLEFEEPMTAPQLAELRKKYNYNDNLIMECARQMHNKNAHLTNRSAYLTMRKWLTTMRPT